MTRYDMTAFFGGLVLVVLSGCQGSVSGPASSTSPPDGSVAPTTATTKPADKGIDSSTVAAYEKEGAVYGGWVKEGRGTFFQPGRDAAEKGLPGFTFDGGFPHAKLPDVAVPFGLQMNSPNVTDKVLTFLVELKHLTRLELFGAKVTDAGMRELAGLKNLTTLNLSQTLVTDDGLKHLAGLDNLTTLHLTRVTGTGLKDLAGLKKLTTLRFNGSVTDAGIKEIVRLKYLTSLSIYAVPGLVTEEGLRELTALENLPVLELTGPAVTDAVLKDLAGMTNLKELWLQVSPVTNAGLKHLASLKNLTVLNLQATEVTPKGVVELQLALPQCEIMTSGRRPNSQDDENALGFGEIRRKELSKDEIHRLVEHMPQPFREGLSDAELAKELETIAFAFDYKGGPFRLWVEIEETGQETMPKRLPHPQIDDWQFAPDPDEGHVCFALRRGVSGRASKLATQAGVKHSTQDVGIYLMYESKKAGQKNAKDNGYNFATGKTNPLWYGWKKYKLDPQYPEVKAKKGEDVTLFVVTAEETTEGVKEPRKVKMTLKAIFGAEKK
jgi:hypothetical protein